MDDDKTKDAQPKALFKTGLWVETFALIKRNPIACLTYLAASSVITWFGGDNLSDSAAIGFEAFITIFLMIPICFSLLKQKHDLSVLGSTTQPYILNFLWRTIALNFGAYVPGAIIAVVMLAYRFSSEASTAASLLVYLILLIIFYSKWGTMLPAIIDDADFTFKTAVERGRKTWSYALANLLVPYVLVIAMFVVLITPVIFLSEGNGEFYSPLTGYDFSVLYENALIPVMGCLTTVMTAVILTRSYLMAEGRN